MEKLDDNIIHPEKNLCFTDHCYPQVAQSWLEVPLPSGQQQKACRPKTFSDRKIVFDGNTTEGDFAEQRKQDSTTEKLKFQADNSSLN